MTARTSFFIRVGAAFEDHALVRVLAIYRR
jgi:hypothetical protein